MMPGHPNQVVGHGPSLPPPGAPRLIRCERETAPSPVVGRHRRNAQVDIDLCPFRPHPRPAVRGTVRRAHPSITSGVHRMRRILAAATVVTTLLATYACTSDDE